MIPTHLFVAFLVAGTTSAVFNNSFYLFAKVDNTLVPLSGDVLDPLGTGTDLFSALCFKKSSIAPIKFTLQDNYAFTEDNYTAGFVGFFQNMFAFGPNITKTKLDLTGDMRVRNADFYSCNGFPPGQVYWIGRNRTVASNLSCFDVDVYFLPCHKYNASAVKYVLEHEEEWSPGSADLREGGLYKIGGAVTETESTAGVAGSTSEEVGSTPEEMGLELSDSAPGQAAYVDPRKFHMPQHQQDSELGPEIGQQGDDLLIGEKMMENFSALDEPWGSVSTSDDDWEYASKPKEECPEEPAPEEEFPEEPAPEEELEYFKPESASDR